MTASDKRRETAETDTLAPTPDTGMQRVIALYGRWVKAGPPPLGTSMSRWWDARLVELHEAILPAAEHPPRTTANHPATSNLREMIARAMWDRQNPVDDWATTRDPWKADLLADADAVLAAIGERLNQTSAGE